MVSHEIRTPLTGILGMAELLTATEMTAEQSSYVDAIRMSGESSSSLINEILDFSKIEAGKLDLNRAVLTCRGWSRGLRNYWRRARKARASKSRHRSIAMYPVVSGDFLERLRQVLSNPAGNAVKFTENGGVGIAIRQAPAGKVLALRCAIRGRAFREDRRHAIFEEFEQVDGSMTRRHEGNGPGPGHIQIAVELMGGDLRLERSGPDGSVFSFSIALPSADSSAEPLE